MKELQDERDNDEVIDNLHGCRSGVNTIKPERGKTGGIFIISTLSGFIIELKEYIHRETSTEVITDTPKAFTTLQSHINYFERLEALGYDNMCNLQTRVHNLGRQSNLSDLEAFFWDDLRSRTFVDRFHIAGHNCPLCSKDHEKCLCCFDISLPKFKEIFATKEFTKYMKSKTFKYCKINDEVKLCMLNKNYYSFILYTKLNR